MEAMTGHSGMFSFVLQKHAIFALDNPDLAYGY